MGRFQCISLPITIQHQPIGVNIPVPLWLNLPPIPVNHPMGNVKDAYLITLSLIRFGTHQTGEGW